MSMDNDCQSPDTLYSVIRESLNFLRYARDRGLLVQEPSAQHTTAETTPLDKSRTEDSLEQIAEEVGICTRCRLSRSRTRTVPGEGPLSATLMVIGEAPGNQEDRRGLPFVGEAGQLLTRMLQSIDEPRATVFITNTVKCRPPGNRNPAQDEITACRPYLDRQIDLIRPLGILALGKFSSQYMLDTTEPISRLRGRIFVRGRYELFPTFHPAYLLRNPDGKRLVWEDLKQLKERLGELRRRTAGSEQGTGYEGGVSPHP